MNFFDGSIERSCNSCGEPFLVFNRDTAHFGEKGCLCGLCAKKEQSKLYSMTVFVIDPQRDTACDHCKRKLTPKDNIYLHDQQTPPFVLCETCDRNLAQATCRECSRILAPEETGDPFVLCTNCYALHT